MLKKLSLAALVAMGSMSIASAATPLEQAIKNVSVSGYLRLRFYNEHFHSGNQDYNRWRTNAKFVFNIPVAENLSFVWRVSDQTDVRDRSTSNIKADVDVTLLDNLFFLKYSNNGLNAIVGKIPVLTPITSADPQTTAHGAGAIATYNVGNGLTVAAGYVDALTNVDDTPLGKTISNDIYTAAAIYSNDAFGTAQVWYFNATSLLDYDWVFVGDFNVLKDYGLALHVDAATGKLDGASDAHNYYHVSVKGQMDQFCGKIGFAQTNDKPGVVELSVDSPIAAIAPTALRYSIANMTDATAVYAKVGMKVDPKTSVYVGATNIHNAAKENSAEYIGGASYQMTKKLAFSAYYDYLNYSSDATAKNGLVDQNEFRFEAKYSF
ncbi:major outer membrane protein [Caminibacter pacificus]|uniref:Major outer membrane protein n=1 Tax=Caminibacter pacificus TaxID=1424653 RepID=A0AAJ4RBX3_9BACT|nr:major outer membrane protein [Caminibacter pacificus]QCI28813.1 major outer membrane protein [Caminibacter pacificus]ROR39401.1 major outer membrane protein [Caminibacter pacificus]